MSDTIPDPHPSSNAAPQEGEIIELSTLRRHSRISETGDNGDDTSAIAARSRDQSRDRGGDFHVVGEGDSERDEVNDIPPQNTPLEWRILLFVVEVAVRVGLGV